MANDDMMLVRQYAEGHSEQAFATLVERHVNLVYSIALRMVRDPHVAEEASQGVFIILARKAGSLDSNTILAAWLCRTARHVALDALKIMRRRQLHEQEFKMQPVSNEPSSEAWNHLAPVLDEAMGQLAPKEHDAVVLRFFEGKEFSLVGAAMGTTEDAARMRVNRALEKLRKFFEKRGVSLSSAAIAGAVSVNSIQIAPAGLAAAVTTAALSGIAINAPFIAATKTALITPLQKVAATAVIAIALGTAIYETRQASIARTELAAIKNQASTSAPPQEPASALGGAEGKLKRAPDEQEMQRLRKEHLELLSLRGQVKLLRDELRQLKAAAAQLDAAPKLAAETNSADSILFSASLTNRVSIGHTLVVGGWSMNGMRGYVFLTPEIRKSEGATNDSPIAIQSQVVGAPESFWNQIGWGEARSDTRRSSVAGVLTPDQAVLLLTALKGTDGSELSNTSVASGGNEEKLGIGFSLDDDRGDGVLMGIDLVPRIAADGQSVELEIRPSSISTNTSIHPYLKQAGKPTPESR